MGQLVDWQGRGGRERLGGSVDLEALTSIFTQGALPGSFFHTYFPFKTYVHIICSLNSKVGVKILRPALISSQSWTRKDHALALMP
eukprot:1154808-Pelagomonas_calceolata.AAC.3